LFSLQKLIQYSLKVYLLFHTSLAASRLLRRPTRPPWEKELTRRLHSTVEGFSFTRWVGFPNMPAARVNASRPRAFLENVCCSSTGCRP
jgi:hypothetical protein